MSKKKRTHYIPRFYLSGFVDPLNDPYLWIYDKQSTDVRKAGARDIAIQKRYYSFTTSTGKTDSESFEDAFAQLEGDTATVFKSISNMKSLDPKKRIIFATFLALMAVRVPSFRTNAEKAVEEILENIGRKIASNQKTFQSWIQRFKGETGTNIEMSLDTLRELFLQDNWKVKVDPQISLQMIPEIAESIARIFYDMNWCFLRAPGNHKFITSDNPVFHLDPKRPLGLLHGMGILDRNIEVTFPVSRDQVFLGTWNGSKGYGTIDSPGVKAINRRMVIMALRFVFASQYSKGLCSLVQKHKNVGMRLRVSSIGPYIVAQRAIESNKKE